MGQLRKRGKIWYLDYSVKGKRFRKKIGSSKKLAELALKEIEVKIAKNELGFLPKDSDLFKLFNEFSDYSKTNHSPATVNRYRAIVNNFKGYRKQYPYITKISHLNAKTFEDYKSFRKEKGAEPKTINIELQTLKSIFTLAIKWGYTNTNPAKDVSPMKVLKKKEPRFLSEKECEKLLANCGDWLYPIFYAFLHTGMRKQELMNLKWSDVDFKRRKIKIRVKDDWTPKTSEMDIPISNGLMEVLKKQARDNKGLVFPDEDGKKIENNKLRKQLIKVTKLCGFPNVTKLHSLRHTFASHLVMKGVDLPTVSKLLGHTDISTTMIYSHLTPDHLVDAVDKLDF